jgi:hypothetical protein
VFLPYPGKRLPACFNFDVQAQLKIIVLKFEQPKNEAVPVQKSLLRFLFGYGEVLNSL